MTKDEAQEKLQKTPPVFGLYKHYKGGEYVLYGASINEEALEEMVHYYSVKKNSRWTRTRRNFFSLAIGHPQTTRFRWMGSVLKETLIEAAGLRLP